VAGCPTSPAVPSPYALIQNLQPSLHPCVSGVACSDLPPHLPASPQWFLLPRGGCLLPGTPRRQSWCSGTGRSTKRTCWATTWTAVWQGPTCGSRATTSPLDTTGALLPFVPEASALLRGRGAEAKHRAPSGCQGEQPRQNLPGTPCGHLCLLGSW
jgi:hypothetical protein